MEIRTTASQERSALCDKEEESMAEKRAPWEVGEVLAEMLQRELGLWPPAAPRPRPPTAWVSLLNVSPKLVPLRQRPLQIRTEAVLFLHEA